MISKKDILSITHHFVKKSGGIPDGRSIHPTRDWFIGLSLASIFFLGAAGYSAYDFYTKYSNVDKMPSSTNSMVTYKQQEAREILNSFQLRKDRFNSLRAERPIIPVDQTAEEVGTEVVEEPLAEEIVTQ